MDVTSWDFDRGTLTLAPSGARVLQVSVDGEDAYWTDPGATGWNVGGDRLWVGPEWAYYWTDLGSYAVSTHSVQDVNGVGRWEVVQSDDTTCSVEQTGRLRHLHGGPDITVRLARSFARADVELGGHRADVAYRTSSRLELVDAEPGATASLWTLLQVPPEGRCLVPAPETLRPRDFFDPAPAGTWQHADGLLRMHLGGNALFKLGLAATTGVDRFLYDRVLPDGRHLVIARHFRVEPGSPYADVPLGDLEGNGSAIEVFCDGRLLGEFSEVEHHSPASSTARPSMSDEMVTAVVLVDADEWPSWLAAWTESGLSAA